MNNDKRFFTLLKGVEVFAPDNIGKKDILIAGDKIAALDKEIEVPTGWDCQVVDLESCSAVPGFIDGHVHLIGGGGEGGYATRTPEVQLGDVVNAGVTTVVGCLGTDGTTRHMSSLLAKARGLEEEGVTTYIYTGSYEVPTNTITRSVRDDIILIDKVIGCGEIAIADHRSAQPNKEDIANLAAQSRVGGMLSGKAGLLQLHVGDGKKKLADLFAIAAEGEIPITQFLPTHISRNPELLEEGIRFAKLGGKIDITTSSANIPGKRKGITAAQAVRYCLEQGVQTAQITLSSDGNGSMPVFDADGQLIGLEAARISSLFETVQELLEEDDLPLENAIRLITENPAKNLKLYPKKGCIQVGSDADLVILDKAKKIQYVFAKGQMMVEKKRQCVFGTFENNGKQ